MTADWPMDPSNETSSDLFGGDLFSDELLDMYHAEDNRKFLGNPWRSLHNMCYRALVTAFFFVTHTSSYIIPSFLLYL